MHPFSSPLKSSENFKVFWCFQGVEKGCIGEECVKLSQESLTSVIVILPSRKPVVFQKEFQDMKEVYVTALASKYSYLEMEAKNVKKN